MPTYTSDVEIYNLALDKMGVEAIQSFCEESKQAELGLRNYGPIRDAYLASHYWNFAMKYSGELNSCSRIQI